MTTLDFGSSQSGFLGWLNDTYGGVVPDYGITGTQLFGGKGAARVRVANGQVHVDGDTITFHNDDGSTKYGTIAAAGVSWDIPNTFNTLAVTNNATVGGTLGVTGVSTLASLGVTNNATVGGTLGVTGSTKLGTLTLNSGAGVNEFSTDGALGGNSDAAVPTEKAVKQYIDAMFPVYEYTVGAQGDYTTIAGATSAAAAAGLTVNQRAVIRVFPGRYTENVVLPRYCDLTGADPDPNATAIYVSGTGVPLTIDNSAGASINTIRNLLIYSDVANSDATGRPALTQASFTNALDLGIDNCIVSRVNARDHKHDGAVHLVPTASHVIVANNCEFTSTSIVDVTGAHQTVGAVIQGTGIWYMYSCRFEANGTASMPMACLLYDDTYLDRISYTYSCDFVTTNAGSNAIGIHAKTTQSITSVGDTVLVEHTAAGGAMCVYTSGITGTATIVGMNGVSVGGANRVGIYGDAESYGCSFTVNGGNVFSGGTTVNGHAFETDAGAVWMYNTGIPPAASAANAIKMWAQDSSDATSTLGLYTEQAVEVGAPTFSHKIKVLVNGTEYWLGLDAVI